MSQYQFVVKRSAMSETLSNDTSIAQIIMCVQRHMCMLRFSQCFSIRRSHYMAVLNTHVLDTMRIGIDYATIEDAKKG